MGILDTNYEENVYEAKNVTLTYNKESGEYEPKTNNLVTYLPNYTSIKNKIDMHIPELGDGVVSPFGNSNPNLGNLFGYHILDKQFGFYDINIINPVSNYPYMGDDVSRKGSKLDYNGVMTGYVLNGISAEDVITTLDETILPTYTINEDDMKNPKTLRVLYTTDDKMKDLSYGNHIIDENNQKLISYFYVPINQDNTYEFIESWKCSIYKIGDDGSYEEVSPIDVIADNDNVNTFYVNTNGDYLQIANIGSFATFDGSGMIYYIKNEDNEFISGGIPSRQYVEITPNNNTLISSDGYGEDAEINVLTYSMAPSSFELIRDFQVIDGEVHTKVLRVSKNDIEDFDTLELYDERHDATIECSETYWAKLETKKDEMNYTYTSKISTLTSFYKVKVDITDTKFYHTNNVGHNICYVQYTFNIDFVIYNLIHSGSNSIRCKNIDTNYQTQKGCSVKEAYAVILGFPSNTNIKYDDSTYDKGYITVTYIPENTEEEFYIGKEVKEIDGSRYYFDDSLNSIMVERTMVSSKPVSIIGEGVYSVKLQCGATITFDDVILDYSRDIVGAIIYNLKPYVYKLSKLQLNLEGKSLEYPQEVTSSIFSLMKNENWNNKCQQINTVVRTETGDYDVDPDNVYFDIQDIETVKYAFVVGKIGGSSSNMPTYYTYGPKICLEIPRIYSLLNNSDDSTIKIVITGTDWTNDYVFTNEYLRYYNMTVNRLSRDENNNYIIEESVFVEPVIQLKKFKSVIDEDVFYGIIVEFTGINNTQRVQGYLYTITDFTGMTINNIQVIDNCKEINDIEEDINA